MPYASVRKYHAEKRFRCELKRAKAILFCGLLLTVFLWLLWAS
jgi:hypothetical protein